MVNDEIVSAMRDEVKFFLQANELSQRPLDENTLMELAMACAARASEIVFKKLDAMVESDYNKIGSV